MTEIPTWWRGPLPSNVVPLKPSMSAGASTPPADVEPPRPTRWKAVAFGDRVVVNPNLCLICHKAPHRTTPHHSFIPDEADESTALRLGWPHPDDARQEHLW